jgi:hypothetical protein
MRSPTGVFGTFIFKSGSGDQLASVLTESKSILKNRFFDPPTPQIHRGDVSEFFSFDSMIRDQYPIDFIGHKKIPDP